MISDGSSGTSGSSSAPLVDEGARSHGSRTCAVVSATAVCTVLSAAGVQQRGNRCHRDEGAEQCEERGHGADGDPGQMNPKVTSPMKYRVSIKQSGKGVSPIPTFSRL